MIYTVNQASPFHSSHCCLLVSNSVNYFWITKAASACTQHGYKSIYSSVAATVSCLTIKKSRDLFIALQNNLMLSQTILILYVRVGLVKYLFISCK